MKPCFAALLICASTLIMAKASIYELLPYHHQSHLYSPISADEVALSRYAPYHHHSGNPEDQLTSQDRADIAYIQDLTREKRSGSGDILGHLKSSIGQGIKSKIGMFASGSKHAISHFSGGSSGHGHSYNDHHYHGKHFDLWSLKKHIFFTLLQTAKAINGLVIAGKGHLLKGGGYLVSGGGRLITAKGEALKNWGKAIATSAMLSPHKTHSSVVEYHPHPHPHPHVSTGYGISHGPAPPVHHHHHTVTGLLVGTGGGHHGPPAHYSDYISSPSAPGPSYEDYPSHAPVGPSSFMPAKYFAGAPSNEADLQHQFGKSAAAHSGLVVLKKIPPPSLEHIHHHEHHHVHAPADHEHHQIHEHPFREHSDIHEYSAHQSEEPHDVVPDFKPIAPSLFLPSVKSIVSSVFSASSVHGDHPSSDGEVVVDYPPAQSHAAYSDDNGNYIGSHSTKHEDKLPPSTSYGTPMGPSVQYFNSKDTVPTRNTNYVTPIQTRYPLPTVAPIAEQFKIEVLDPTPSTDPRLYIGLNFPLNTDALTNIKDFPSGALPDEFVARYLTKQIAPTFNSLQLHDPRFHINNSAIDGLISAGGNKVIRKMPSSDSKRSPMVDIVRSVAFELGPNGPVKL